MKAVRIVNETGKVHDTKITCAETGTAIEHIKSVTVRYSIKEIPAVRLEMAFPLCDVRGSPAYYLPGPDGVAKRVKSIVFDDGTTWPSET